MVEDFLTVARVRVVRRGQPQSAGREAYARLPLHLHPGLGRGTVAVLDPHRAQDLHRRELAQPGWRVRGASCGANPSRPQVQGHLSWPSSGYEPAPRIGGHSQEQSIYPPLDETSRGG